MPNIVKMFWEDFKFKNCDYSIRSGLVMSMGISVIYLQWRKYLI